MRDKFAKLLDLHWDEEFISTAEIAKKLDLPVETIQKWRAGQELPTDGWYLNQLGKLLQLRVTEIDRLLVAAGLDPEFGTWQPQPAIPVIPVTPQPEQTRQKTPPGGGGSTAYDFSGDFRGAIFNINCWMEGVVQTTGTQSRQWTPPPLETLFFIAYRREKEQIRAAYAQVQKSGRGQVVLLTGRPGSGRHALVKWLTEQTPVNQNNIYSADPNSPPLAASLQLLEKTREKSPTPSLFVIENLKQDEEWLTELSALMREITNGQEKLPVLLIVTITTRKPINTLDEQDRLAPFVQTVQQDNLAPLLDLRHTPLSYQEIDKGIASNDKRLAGRLYELSGGRLYWSEIIWQEWTNANERGVEKDAAGRWRAASDENGELTIYASVARQVSNQLANLLSRRQMNGPHLYTRNEAEEILQCAATEGQWFTVEAIANVLHLDREALITFFDLLQPYVDENDPEQDIPGIVTQSSIIQIDPERPDSIVVEYKFTRPYLYYAWRKHPPLKATRNKWKHLLADALMQLYQPYETMILEKLEMLAPKLAAPYRQRRQRQVTLQQLRSEVYSLLNISKGNHFADHRLFDVGVTLLNLLADNPKFAKEGIALAQNLYGRAAFWHNTEIKTKAAYYWSWHLHNAGYNDEALPLAQEAVTLCKEEHLEPLLYAATLSNMGILLQEKMRLEEARPYYEDALAITQKALGPDHPNTAATLNNLGYLLRAMGRLEEARPYYEEALAIRQKALAPDHPATATSLNNMGALLQEMGRLEEARPYIQQALAILETKLGPNHPHTKIVRGNLQSL
jgi:tetratricopeptide (TPR) repeat protein